MKKLLLLAISGMFLISCGGGGSSDEDIVQAPKGWLDKDVAQAMKDCKKEGGNSESECECVIGKAESKFESYAAMMQKMDDGPESEEEEEDLMNWMMDVSKDCGIDF